MGDQDKSKARTDDAFRKFIADQKAKEAAYAGRQTVVVNTPYGSKTADIVDGKPVIVQG